MTPEDAAEVRAIVADLLDERMGPPGLPDPPQKVRHAPGLLAGSPRLTGSGWGKPSRITYCSVYRGLASIAKHPADVTCRQCLQQIGRTVLRYGTLPWPLPAAQTSGDTP